MEHFGAPYYWLCVCLVLVTHLVVRSRKRRPCMLPPGPRQLPVIGSLHHLLCPFPHHALRDLSQRHGPLMLLRICEHMVVVVSSMEMVGEIFKGHGTTFEQRPRSPGIDEVYSGYGTSGVIFAPYGEHWRQLRQILMMELLSARRVETFRHIRQEETGRLMMSLASSPQDQLVNVDELLAGVITDTTVRVIFGDRLPLDRAAFLKMMKHITDVSSLMDISDLFPSSRLVRMLPRGRNKVRHRQQMSRLIDEILQEHKKRRDGEEQDDNMIAVLLRLQKEGTMQLPLTPGLINALTMEIFGAALDQTVVTLQWAMAELMANPRVMEKAQQEIRRVLAGQKVAHESTLKEMHYLKAVIKETLRLHPPAPLIPRLCTNNKKIQGYDVPQGTIVVVNAWAISRDPNYWEQDSEVFLPERFEGEGAFDYKGSNLEFTPFGFGRRICPGINFAQANIEIVLASLLYHFDWELPSQVKNDGIDMTESFGVTVKRKTELMLYPIHRIPVVYAHE